MLVCSRANWALLLLRHISPGGHPHLDGGLPALAPNEKVQLQVRVTSMVTAVQTLTHASASAPRESKTWN